MSTTDRDTAIRKYNERLWKLLGNALPKGTKLEGHQPGGRVVCARTGKRLGFVRLKYDGYGYGNYNKYQLKFGTEYHTKWRTFTRWDSFAIRLKEFKPIPEWQDRIDRIEREISDIEDWADESRFGKHGGLPRWDAHRLAVAMTKHRNGTPEHLSAVLALVEKTNKVRQTVRFKTRVRKWLIGPLIEQKTKIKQENQ